MSAPLVRGRLTHVFIRARRLPELVAFYRDVLGLEVVVEDENRFAFFRLGGTDGPQLALYPGRADDGAAEAHWFLVVDVPDVEAVSHVLRGRGVQVGPVEDVPGGRAATFRDPEGNEIEIHEPLQPSS